MRIISSMATRRVLAELTAALPQSTVQIESVGGVDAARRLRAGESFDVVVLASTVIDALIDEGHARPGSRVDLFRSGIAVAVKAGAARPDIENAAALESALRAARSVGYSTGPSGDHVVRLLQRWGLDGSAAPRIVQAAPGMPVGGLVAAGEVELGFQQASEFIDVDGITVLGPLPDDLQLLTTFSAAVVATSGDGAAARALIDALASPRHVPIIRRCGMEPGRRGAC